MLLLLAVGISLFVYGVVALFKRKPLKAGVHGLLGSSLVLAGGFGTLLLTNIHTYYQLTQEVVLADITMGQATPSGVPIKIKSNGREQVYLIRSDEWRIDARFLKWKPWMSLLGKEPLVRLERLEERSAKDDRYRLGTRYDLNEDHRWLDSFVTELSRDMGLIDSLYGSSVYMPARPGAVYQVSASISGLLARPRNETARKAIIQWSDP